MTIHRPFQSLRRIALSSCVALALLAAAIPARADNPPKFKDPEVTAFFQKVSDNIDALLAAVQAKDDAKVKELNAKMETIMKDGEPLKAKATPEEREAVRAWFKTQFKKLKDAGFTPPA